MLFENENTEFKSILIKDIWKPISAFANTKGGTIYIGKDNFENNTSFNQDLTFSYLNSILGKHKIEISNEKLYALGIKSKENCA